MKKYPQFSSLAFTLLFTQNFAHAYADKKLGTSGDEASLLKLNMGISVIRQGGIASTPYYEALGTHF